MATFNGGKYIKEQIDSIINQTYKDWILYVRDDGSNDDTKKIVKEYTRLYPAKIVLLHDEINHRGSTKSFMWMMEQINADYYMFSDQDDVWLDNKIRISIDTIKKHEEFGKPTLCFTDLSVADEFGETIAPSMWKYTHMDKYIGCYSALYAASVTGCTMIFNNKAKEVSLQYKNYNGIHDNIITLAVIRHKGIIIPIFESTILYRQHSNNVLGVKEFDNSFMFRIKNMRKILRVTINHMYLVYRINNINILEFIVLNIAKKILLHNAN